MVTLARQQALGNSGTTGYTVGPSVADTSAAGGTIVAPTVAPYVPTPSTAVSTPASSPVAVTSSTSAANDVTGNISNTVTNAQNAIDTQATQNAAAAKAAADAAATKTSTSTSNNQTTPESQIANTPDPGQMFVYDKATGTRSEVPVGTPLNSTQTMTNVLSAGAQDTVSNGSTTYKQFADGTYGAYDDNGNYIGAASASTFASAKGAAKSLSDLQAIQNGTYPLTAGQQAQMDQVASYYQGLIEKQQTENANVTGNMTGLQNLYGVGGTSVGTSAINQTIADGAAKVAEINRQMVNAINGLRSAIQTDDINTVKSLYSEFQNNVDAKQKAIDQMHNDVLAAATKADNDLQNYLFKASTAHPDAGIDGTEQSIAEINAKILKSETFKAKQVIVDTTPVDGNAPDPETANIPSSVTGKTPDALWKDANDYNLSGKTLQAFIGGLSSATQANAYKAAISNKSAEVLKAAGISSVSTLQQEYKANSTALNQLTQNMNNVDLNVTKAEDGVNQIVNLFSKNGVNTYDSTFLNKKLNSLSKNFANSGDLRAYQAGVFEVANDYSQVFTRGGARNQAADERAQEILSGDITLGDFIKVTDELQKQGKIVVNDSITQMQKTANGGTDDVAKYLRYINSAPSGSAGSTTSGTDTSTSGSDSSSGSTYTSPSGKTFTLPNGI